MNEDIYLPDYQLWVAKDSWGPVEAAALFGDLDPKFVRITSNNFEHSYSVPEGKEYVKKWISVFKTWSKHSLHPFAWMDNIITRGVEGTLSERLTNGIEKRALIEYGFKQKEMSVFFPALIHKLGSINTAKIDNAVEAPTHSTHLMKLMGAAVKEFWKDYKPGDTSPKSPKIVEWLVEKGASNRQAQAIDLIIRPDTLKKGGNKRLKKSSKM